MALPFDAAFVYNIAKCSSLDTYRVIIDGASQEQIYSLVTILNKHNQCPAGYYSWFSIHDTHLKTDLHRDYYKIRSAACAALIIDLTCELVKCKGNENL